MPALIAEARSKLAPADDECLVSALTHTIALLGFQGGQDARAEWIAAAAVRLQDLPGDLALEGLAEAQRTCRTAGAALAAAFAYAEDYPARLRGRLGKLLVLADALR